MKFATWGFVFWCSRPQARFSAGGSPISSRTTLARRARGTPATRRSRKLRADKVWTNDDIPQSPGSVSVVGQAGSGDSAARADSSASAANGANKPGDSTARPPRAQAPPTRRPPLPATSPPPKRIS